MCSQSGKSLLALYLNGLNQFRTSNAICNNVSLQPEFTPMTAKIKVHVPEVLVH
jgi:hypothetical protein